MIVDGNNYLVVYMFDLESRIEVLRDKLMQCFPQSPNVRIKELMDYAVLYICNDVCFIHCDRLLQLRHTLTPHERGRVETISLYLERVLYTMLLPMAPSDVMHVDNITIKDNGELYLCWKKGLLHTWHQPMKTMQRPSIVSTYRRSY